MAFGKGVTYACLVVALCIGADAAHAEDAKQPKVTTNVASGCPDYCSDSKCSTISHEVVCSVDGSPTELYWETCASIASYDQVGSKCNGNPRTRWQDEGETLGC